MMGNKFCLQCGRLLDTVEIMYCGVMHCTVQCIPWIFLTEQVSWYIVAGFLRKVALESPPGTGGDDGLL